PPQVWAEGLGATTKDPDGNIYIDTTGGIAVANVGRCHPRVVEAVKNQADKLMLTGGPMDPTSIAVSKKMAGIMPEGLRDNCFTAFLLGGSDAVETSLKYARAITGNTQIIGFEGAYHGVWFGSLGLTTNLHYVDKYGPTLPGIFHMPYAYCYRCSYGLKYPSCGIYCADFIQEKFFDLYAAAESIAAIIVEPVQGEGGFIVPPKEYLGKLQKICKDNGIVLIVDEIQSGFARTGKMFAFEHSGVEPDILVTAKSLAAGLPLAGVTGKAEIMDSVDNAGIGGTFGGNPLCCRAGLAVLKILKEKKLAERSNAVGKKVMEKFKSFYKKYSFVGDVRGLGGMNAMEIVVDKKNPKPNGDLAKAIVRRCYDKGLIMLTAGGYGNVIRHLVPLVVTDEQLDRGLKILEEAMAEKAE
ncbi:MAG: aspartate aminotransferase family protein, partial [Thermodesulfobacteriota bacterium]